MMDEQFHENMEHLIELENESVIINSKMLQDMMDRGVRQYIAEHNIQLYNQHPELNKDLMLNVFGRHPQGIV